MTHHTSKASTGTHAGDNKNTRQSTTENAGEDAWSRVAASHRQVQRVEDTLDVAHACMHEVEVGFFTGTYTAQEVLALGQALLEWADTLGSELAQLSSPGATLVRTKVVEPACECRGRSVLQVVAVAHGAVHDDGHDTAHTGVAPHEAADDSPVGAAASRDDERLARLDEVERGMDRQIVTRADSHRAGGAGDHMPRRQPTHRPDPDRPGNRSMASDSSAVDSL